MQDDPKLFEDWVQFDHWANFFHQQIEQAVAGFTSVAAKAAEAKERGEDRPLAQLPDFALQTLQNAQDNPEATARLMMAMHAAALRTIAEILRSCRPSAIMGHI